MNAQRNDSQVYYMYQLDNKNVVRNVFRSHASQQDKYTGI
jgi:hypothetical protein